MSYIQHLTYDDRSAFIYEWMMRAHRDMRAETYTGGERP
jgi:hypothetical protein